ncbi:MAG: hypothetical protein NZ924_06425 [Candidatus Bipolaricaulota bacterium]|nr:hypothetical protein [Candidatus Bipolaricaulota bacterium]MDW8152515.1 hypothetical protein [Candidatus Bipolaricaulota bacterium]
MVAVAGIASGWGSSAWAAPWGAFGIQVAVGTLLGYAGGLVGAQAASALVQALGVGTVQGVLAPVLAAYVGYAVGSTLGAGLGVVGVGWRLGIPGDPWAGLFGAGVGTGLAFLLASFADWEWAFCLSPPLSALFATLAFTSALRAPP